MGKLPIERCVFLPGATSDSKAPEALADSLVFDSRSEAGETIRRRKCRLEPSSCPVDIVKLVLTQSMNVEPDSV